MRVFFDETSMTVRERIGSAPGSVLLPVLASSVPFARSLMLDALASAAPPTQTVPEKRVNPNERGQRLAVQTANEAELGKPHH